MSKAGFTLIELLVVIAILGILSTVGLMSFRLNQAKARDAQRKSDLEQVQRALEMYFNDYNDYPAAAAGGLIMGISWGGEFEDVNNTVYMKELPQDPGSTSYCYEHNTAPISYRLYAKLENTQTPGYGGPYACGSSGEYNYVVGSSNLGAPITPTP